MRSTNRIAPWIVLGVMGTQAALSTRGANVVAPRVDFAYAFSPPHRITVGRPDSSERTLSISSREVCEWRRAMTT